MSRAFRRGSPSGARTAAPFSAPPSFQAARYELGFERGGDRHEHGVRAMEAPAPSAKKPVPAADAKPASHRPSRRRRREGLGQARAEKASGPVAVPVRVVPSESSPNEVGHPPPHADHLLGHRHLRSREGGQGDPAGPFRGVLQDGDRGREEDQSARASRPTRQERSRPSSAVWRSFSRRAEGAPGRRRAVVDPVLPILVPPLRAPRARARTRRGPCANIFPVP